MSEQVESNNLEKQPVATGEPVAGELAERAPVDELIAVRRQKLNTLQAEGVDPFGQAFPVTGSVQEVRDLFAEGAELRIAGRVTAHRDMGRSHFLDLSDITGRIQIYLNTKELDEAAVSVLKKVDLGDLREIAAVLRTYYCSK